MKEYIHKYTAEEINLAMKYTSYLYNYMCTKCNTPLFSELNANQHQCK